jgi:hypothetical protein
MYYEALLSPGKAAREVQMKLDNHGNHKDNCSDNLFEYYPMNTSLDYTIFKGAKQMNIPAK